MAEQVMEERKFWRCPACGRQFARQGQRHSCKTVSLDFHFERRKKEKLLYTKLIQAIKKETGPFQEEVLRCCIHLVNPATFAAIRIMRNKIRIDFTLSYKVSHPRLIYAAQVSAHRYLYYVDVTDPGEVDGELMDWIGEACHREKRQQAEK